MPIFSVRDNENNRWKRNVKKKTKSKYRKELWGTEAIVILLIYSDKLSYKELNDFVGHLS